MAFELQQFTKAAGDRMRAERIPVVDPDKDQIQGKLAANSFSNRPSLTSLRDAKRDEAERIPVVAPAKGQIKGKLAANSFSNRPSLTSLRDAKRDEAEPQAEEVEKIEQVKIPNPLDAEIVVDAPEPEVPVEPEEEQDPIRTEIELIKAELHELRASVNNQGTDIEDEHDDDIVLTTGPHRNKYTGEFAIYYKNSGSLFVDDGLIICPNGTGTWSASEEAFATNEYVVLKITLDSDLSFLSAELEAEATLADIVSEGLIHRRVIGKKLADPFYIQYHEGTIVIDSGLESKDQFEVVQTASNEIKIRGGVWQDTVFQYQSADVTDYETDETLKEPEDSSTITWTGDSGQSSSLSDEITLASDSEVWAELDLLTSGFKLEIHIKSSSYTPPSDGDAIWKKLSEISWSVSEIDEINQNHQGSITSVRLGLQTVTCITDIQYDTTSHRLEYKTTKFMTAKADAESSTWSEITTAVGCP